jgi:tripartite-type tricarboxylate transporter receptor subunit TctC
MKNRDNFSKKNMVFTFNTLLLAAIGTIYSGSAMAEYPERPISLVIPYGSGGATDISARALSQVLSDYSPKPIVLVNRDGAGGVMGSAHVANSRADGYTLLAARVGSHSVNPAMKSNLPYTLEDFSFIGIYEINPMVCAANVESGIKNMDDLIAKIRSEPGTVAYSSSGVGSMQQLTSVMVLDSFGVTNPLDETVHLPMRGGGGASTAILNGSGSFLCESSSVVMNFIKAGQLVPLMVTSKERLPGIDAPTAAELGHPELEILVGWTGIAGPKALKSDVTDEWVGWMEKATTNSDFVQRMETLGSEVVNIGPDESLTFVNTQYSAFRKLVDKFGMRIN